MSTLISSPEVISSVVTSYAWTGTANLSASVESVNGVETRRNRANNPLNGTSLTNTSAVRCTTALVEDYVRATVNDTTPGAFGSRLQVSSTTRIPVVAGEELTVAVDLRNSTGQAMGVQALWYDASGTFMSGLSTVLSAAIPVEAESFTRYRGSATPPAGAAAVFFYIGPAVGTRTVGDTFDARRLMVGAVEPYFDGSTPGGRIDTTARTAPLQVLGYTSSRPSRNILHEVLGRSDLDVTLRTPGLRTGTLVLLYAGEDESAEGEAVHSSLYPTTLVSSERPSVNMTYVVNGEMRRALEDSTRELWTLEIPFQEVTP